MKSTATNTATKKEKAKPTVAKAALTKAKEIEAQVPVVNPELDEDEDLDEAATSGGSAPAFGKEENTAHTPKNFRNHPDMENFFRFIYENDLRVEALHILDDIIAQQNLAPKK